MITGDTPDISIFRLPGGMKDSLMFGEKVEADFGYCGEDAHVSTPDDFADNIFTYNAKAEARARHECINGKLKSFSVLKQVFRHRHCHHAAVFTAVAVLTQLEIENGGVTYVVEWRAAEE